MKQFFTTLLCLIIIGALGVGGYFIYKAIDGRQTSPEESNVVITINDKTLTEKTTEMEFGFGSENNVTIKGTEEYKVKIVSNDEKSFTYVVDGKEVVFEKLELTDKFDIEYRTTGFKLVFPEDFMIDQLLAEYHDGEEVKLPILDDMHLFKLVIEVEELEYNVVFSVDRIVLSSSTIVI